MINIQSEAPLVLADESLITELLGDAIQEAHDVLSKFIPNGSELYIDEYNHSNIPSYRISITYTSAKSGRSMTKFSSLGSSLPTKGAKRYDSVVRFYMAPVLMTVAETAREFSRMAWRERRARQDAFLFGGGKARGNDIRVSDPVKDLDNLTFEELI